MRPIQIPNWVVQQAELWRFVGFVSSLVGLLCYALSSSFNHLFGHWNLLKMILYSALSFILCMIMLFAKKWQLSTSLLFKAHLGVLVLTLTSVYSFFYDKAVNGKPDAFSLISCAAFAVMSLSLSRQTHLGFEVDLLYFFLGCFIVQLMKIQLILASVGAGFSYSLLLLRSSLDSLPVPDNESLELQDHVVIQMDGSPNAVVLVASQQPSAPIFDQLVACAEALEQNNKNLAVKLLKQVDFLALPGGAMRKVGCCFARALASRINGIYSQEALDPSVSDLLYKHFYESCPHLKFAHFTANQAILEAFASANRVHVIDLGLKQGMQWPALMQALALRPGGPPNFRLSGIGQPQPNNADPLQLVGWELAELAETLGLEFEFRGFVCQSLADLDPSVLEIRPGEVVAVNSVFELHRSLARPGAIEKVVNTIKAVEPKIVTVVEKEANHNGPAFLERFTEAFHYYSNLFEPLGRSSSRAASSEESALCEWYLDREICNVVGCEGEDRVERHETMSQWRERMVSAGFDPVHFGPNALEQAKMMLGQLTCGDGYRVEEDSGCLMLGLHSRPLVASSAWKIPPSQSSVLALLGAFVKRGRV